MNADKTMDLDLLTERVLGAVFEVSNTLGAGFLEKVYERALLRELSLCGIRATAQTSFEVIYKGHAIGKYFADILVEDVLVVELKCVEHLASEHTAQCINYLRASGRTVCLLVNLQRPKVEWKRVVHRFETAGWTRPTAPVGLTVIRRRPRLAREPAPQRLLHRPLDAAHRGAARHRNALDLLVARIAQVG